LSFPAHLGIPAARSAAGTSKLSCRQPQSQRAQRVGGQLERLVSAFICLIY